METYKRTITVEDELNIEKLDKSVAVKTSNDQYFVSRQDFDRTMNRKSDIFTALDSVERRYLYPNEEFWKHYNNYGFFLQDGIEKFFDCQVKAFDAIKQDNFTEDNLTWFWGDSHLLYKLDAEFPISPVIYQDYINGRVDNRNYNLDKAKEALEKSSYVWGVELIDIPYYNAEVDCNQALEFYVRLPQKEWARLCRTIELYNKEFWSVEATQAMIYGHHSRSNYNFPDYLNLKDAYIEKNEER